MLEFRQRTGGAGHFGFEWVGTDLARLSLPDMQLERITPTYDGDNIQWGVELLRDGDYIYIYGMSG